MVLEAMGGVPVTIKDIQFSTACPIASSPRLLQLKLSHFEGQYDPIEFKISSTTNRYLFLFVYIPLFFFYNIYVRQQHSLDTALQWNCSENCYSY